MKSSIEIYHTNSNAATVKTVNLNNLTRDQILQFAYAIGWLAGLMNKNLKAKGIVK
jgi:hypothetical protein